MEAKVIEKLDLIPTGQSYLDNQRAEHKRIIENGRKIMEAKEIEKLWRKNHIFVYKKNGVIRCVDSVDLVETMKEEQKLIKDGWVHTSTIDPIVFIENLHNVRKIDTEL